MEDKMKKGLIIGSVLVLASIAVAFLSQPPAKTEKIYREALADVQKENYQNAYYLFSPLYSFTPHIVTDLSPYHPIAFLVETLSLSPPSPFTLHHIHLTHCKNYQHLISLVHHRIK